MLEIGDRVNLLPVNIQLSAFELRWNNIVEITVIYITLTAL